MTCQGHTACWWQSMNPKSMLGNTRPTCFFLSSPAIFRFGLQPTIPDPTFAQSASSTVLFHDPCGGVGAGGAEGRERLHLPRGELESGLFVSHTCRQTHICLHVASFKEDRPTKVKHCFLDGTVRTEFVKSGPRFIFLPSLLQPCSFYSPSDAFMASRQVS